MKVNSDTTMAYIAYADRMEKHGFEPMSFKDWEKAIANDKRLTELWQEVDQNAG